MKEISRHRTVLMGFSALWIYYFHIVPVGLFSRWPGLLAAENYVHNEGFCGVDIFLLVSSFGLSYAFAKAPVNTPKEYGRYLIRRLSRLYTVLLPVALVQGLVDNWSLREFLGKLFGVHQLAVNVYSFLWFLPCILIFYLLAPFYAALFHRASHKWLFTAIAICLVIGAEFALRPVARSDLYAIFTRIPVFLLGFYFGHLSQTGKEMGKRGYLLALLSLVVGVSYSYLLSIGKAAWILPALNAQLNLLIAPPLALFLAKACELGKGSRAPKAVKAVGRGITALLTFFGTISLEVYATQEWTWLKMQNSSTLLRLFGGTGVMAQIACFALVVIASVALHAISQWLSKLISPQPSILPPPSTTSPS